MGPMRRIPSSGCSSQLLLQCQQPAEVKFCYNQPKVLHFRMATLDTKFKSPSYDQATTCSPIVASNIRRENMCLLHLTSLTIHDCHIPNKGAFVSTLEKNDYETKIFYIIEKVENRFFFRF